MADITKRLEQHLFNEQLDTTVEPPALVLGIKGKNPTGGYTAINVDSVGNLVAGGLVPANYDYISLGYTGSNLTTVVYKSGGSGGTTLATLTLAYTGSVLDSITKT